MAIPGQPLPCWHSHIPPGSPRMLWGYPPLVPTANPAQHLTCWRPSIPSRSPRMLRGYPHLVPTANPAQHLTCWCPPIPSRSPRMLWGCPHLVPTAIPAQHLSCWAFPLRRTLSWPLGLYPQPTLTSIYLWLPRSSLLSDPASCWGEPSWHLSPSTKGHKIYPYSICGPHLVRWCTHLTHSYPLTSLALGMPHWHL